jgi:hypothetical protein
MGEVSVACPYCQTVLDGGQVDVTAWGQVFFIKLRWKRSGAGLFEYKKLMGGFDRRPAGVCPACEAVVIAPLHRPTT